MHCTTPGACSAGYTWARVMSERDDFSDVVATDLYNPDTGSKMPDIDKLFSQVPLPEDFEDSASDSARANLPKSPTRAQRDCRPDN